MENQKQAADACREAFERSLPDAGGYDFARDKDGDYVAPDTWEAYQGWQARGEYETLNPSYELKRQRVGMRAHRAAA